MYRSVFCDMEGVRTILIKSDMLKVNGMCLGMGPPARNFFFLSTSGENVNLQLQFVSSTYAFLYITFAASSNDDCETAICKCDSVAAECFAKNEINPAYEDYPQSQCK